MSNIAAKPIDIKQYHLIIKGLHITSTIFTTAVKLQFHYFKKLKKLSAGLNNYHVYIWQVKIHSSLVDYMLCYIKMLHCWSNLGSKVNVMSWVTGVQFLAWADIFFAAMSREAFLFNRYCRLNFLLVEVACCPLTHSKCQGGKWRKLHLHTLILFTVSESHFNNVITSLFNRDEMRYFHGT